MKKLAYDMARCAARFNFTAGGKWCEHRQSCQRFLAFTEWDKAAGIPHYRGIPVTMGRADCDIKIEVGE
jgi:hypothetical protein